MRSADRRDRIAAMVVVGCRIAVAMGFVAVCLIVS
jgi:hypothetical protein